MAMAFAVLGGFVPGIAMGLMQSAGEVGTTSYRMLAQLHGRAQYFGFANTLVLAVALYFLPRLRGVPVTSVLASNVAIGMVAMAAVVRIVLAVSLVLPLERIPLVDAVSVTIAALLTLSGNAVALLILVSTDRRGTGSPAKSAIAQVRPLIGMAWMVLLTAQVIDLASAVQVVRGGLVAVLPVGTDDAVLTLAGFGWFVPLAVAFASRTFPLFLRTPVVSPTWLVVILPGYVIGLGAQVGANLGFVPDPVGLAGSVVMGVGLLGWIRVLGVFGRRLPRAGRIADPAVRRAERLVGGASDLAIVMAMVWLAVAGVLLVLVGIAGLTGVFAPPSGDVIRHAMGAGVLLPLVVGMSLRMLPGFAGLRPDAVGIGASWVASGFAVTAGLSRIGPGLVSWIMGL